MLTFRTRRLESHCPNPHTAVTALDSFHSLCFDSVHSLSVCKAEQLIYHRQTVITVQQAPVQQQHRLAREMENSAASGSKTVIVTGASGLLGKAVLDAFIAAGWRTIGLAFSRAHLHPNLIKINITDQAAVAALISKEKPDVIVHCAAEKSPDAFEAKEEESKKLNVDATAFLAESACRSGIFLIYISSDYVFDGTAPPYREDAVPHPLNKYGESKLAGEQAVLSVNPDGAAVLRIPVLYGAVEKLSDSAITVLFEKLLDPTKPAKMSYYERRFPTHAVDVANATVVLAEARLMSDSVKGIYHRSASECFTKYEMLLEMARIFALSADHVVAETEAAPGGATRPFDSALSCERLAKLNPPACIPFKDGIRAVLAPFKK